MAAIASVAVRPCFRSVSTNLAGRDARKADEAVVILAQVPGPTIACLSDLWALRAGPAHGRSDVPFVGDVATVIPYLM